MSLPRHPRHRQVERQMGVCEGPRQRAAALGDEPGAAPFLERGISHPAGELVAPEQGLQGRQDLALGGHPRSLSRFASKALFKFAQQETCNHLSTEAFAIMSECGQRVAPVSAARQPHRPRRGFRPDYALTFMPGDFMSIAAIQWAFDLTLADPTAKIVLLALADHYNDQQQCCWPSLTRLEQFTGADERTIQRAIARLIDEGHITRETRAGSSSLFYLHMDPRQIDATPRQDGAPPPSKRRDTPVKLTPHPRQDDTHNPYLTVNDPLSNGAGSLAPNGARPLTTREEWAKRLEGHRPSKRNWKPFWGPPPDQLGDGHLMPKDMLATWRRAHSFVRSA